MRAPTILIAPAQDTCQATRQNPAALATANDSLARLRGLGGEPDDEIVSCWLSQSIPIVPP